MKQNRGVGNQGNAAAMQNINVDPDVAMNNQVQQLQRIVGVRASEIMHAWYVHQNSW